MFSATKNRQDILVYRTSFILRCWLAADEQLRILLINAQTGATYPVTDLAELPAMLNSLIPEELCIPAQDDAPAPGKTGAGSPKETES